MTETLAHGHFSENAQWELSNEYQHDRVEMIFKILGGGSCGFRGKKE